MNFIKVVWGVQLKFGLTKTEKPPLPVMAQKIESRKRSNLALSQVTSLPAGIDSSILIAIFLFTYLYYI